MEEASRFCGWWSAWGLGGIFVASLTVPFMGRALLIVATIIWVIGLIAAGGYIAGTRWRRQPWRVIIEEVFIAFFIGIGFLVAILLLGGNPID